MVDPASEALVRPLNARALEAAGQNRASGTAVFQWVEMPCNRAAERRRAISSRSTFLAVWAEFRHPARKAEVASHHERAAQLANQIQVPDFIRFLEPVHDAKDVVKDGRELVHDSLATGSRQRTIPQVGVHVIAPEGERLLHHLGEGLDGNGVVLGHGASGGA